MALPVTLLYGGICALLVTLLGSWVSILRLQTSAYVGKEPPKPLVRPIRAHGNAAEWVPLAVILLAMLELSGVDSRTLHAFGGTLVVTRLLHAFGILFRNRASMIGATINYFLLAAMSALAIWKHFPHA